MRSRFCWGAPWAPVWLVPAWRVPAVRRTRFCCTPALLACALLSSMAARAQQPPDLKEVLTRLDRLEIQNRELMDELRSLRQQLAAGPLAPTAAVESAAATPGNPASTQGASPAVPLAERVDVQEQRIAQIEQSKVSSEHRLPVTLTGMVLFNAFMNGKGSGGVDNPTMASATLNQADGGATMRQTVLGLKFDGPDLQGGGKLTGSIYMDFFGGGTGLTQTMRLRVASLDAAWKNTTLTFAFDKPIISPREPDSLSQVGVSPLTSAGNLWLWQPQARVEQRFALGDQAGLRAQFGVYQTSESGTGLSTEYTATLARSRPGYEGRFELWANGGENRRIEIAPGFHFSDTHVLGQTVPSQIFSIDWLIRPAARVDVTGTFFQGENVGVVGGLRQGVSVFYDRNALAVHATGGWAQLKVRIAPRLSMNLYGGQESDRASELEAGGISRNLGYAANIMYRLGTNILTGLEASQVRTTYLGSGTRLNPHYDLAIAYLF
jgi:hypothetical protein